MRRGREFVKPSTIEEQEDRKKKLEERSRLYYDWSEEHYIVPPEIEQWMADWAARQASPDLKFEEWQKNRDELKEKISENPAYELASLLQFNNGSNDTANRIRDLEFRLKEANHNSFRDYLERHGRSDMLEEEEGK